MNQSANRKLITTPNLAKPDDAYQMLLSAHDGLSDADSAALNARLILTLMNHIGDPDVLADAIAVAKPTGR